MVALEAPHDLQKTLRNVPIHLHERRLHVVGGEDELSPLAVQEVREDEDVVLHRIRLNYEALADGVTGAELLEELLHELGATPSAARG